MELLLLKNVAQEKGPAVTIYSSGSSVYISNTSGLEMKGEVIVYNMVGQAMLQRTLGETPLTSINLTANAGCYLVKVVTGDKVYSVKVIIK